MTSLNTLWPCESQLNNNLSVEAPEDLAVNTALMLVKAREFLSCLNGGNRGTIIPKDTPGRVTRALLEMTSGYEMSPAEILAARFSAPGTDPIICTGIRFASTCEHHIMPFFGTATIAYLPKGKVVGISKLPRLMECFSKRLQLQERLTSEVAQCLQQHLGPEGVGVIIRAHHCCMGCRGVHQPDAELVTSCMLGCFKDDLGLRSEILRHSP